MLSFSNFFSLPVNLWTQKGEPEGNTEFLTNHEMELHYILYVFGYKKYHKFCGRLEPKHCYIYIRTHNLAFIWSPIMPRGQWSSIVTSGDFSQYILKLNFAPSSYNNSGGGGHKKYKYMQSTQIAFIIISQFEVLYDFPFIHFYSELCTPPWGTLDHTRLTSNIFFSMIKLFPVLLLL